MRILIAEDQRATAHLLKTILKRAGYDVTLVEDGEAALNALRAEVFDALLTDWRMPKLDGIGLIHQVREFIEPTPLIIMVTVVDTLQGRLTALNAGADDYVSKPVLPLDLLERLEDGLTRLRISRRFLNLPPLSDSPGAPRRPHVRSRPPLPMVNPPRAKALSPSRVKAPPPPRSATPRPSSATTPQPARTAVTRRPRSIRSRVQALTVTASTGGPAALVEFFKALSARPLIPIFVVLHGPGWMLKTYSKRLSEAARREVHYVEAPEVCEPGAIYLAPGDKHMRVVRRGGKIWVEAFDGPKENFIRPAADPLFRSVAEIYRREALAVILTGMGRDGTQGATRVVDLGGVVYAQTPESAVAPSMPKSVIQAGLAEHLSTAEGLGLKASEALSRS